MLNISNQIYKYVHDNGPLTFRDFMDKALYDKKFGYYTVNKQNKPDSISDYFTSPQTHPSFALIITIFLKNVYDLLSRKKIHVLEEGAGEGILARYISRFSKTIDKKFGNNLSYIATDKFSRYSYSKINDLKINITRNVDFYLSNELIDSFPVHRFRIKSKKIKEILVGVKAKKLSNIELTTSNIEIIERISPYTTILPEGYIGEICTEYQKWSDRVSQFVKSGIVISIDYGHEIENFYDPKRKNGLLRCYDNHTINSNPYINPGKQDITSHVDFTSLNKALENSGFIKLFDLSQKEFLEIIGIKNLIDDLKKKYNNKQINHKTYKENLAGMLLLTDSKGLGKFKVLIHCTKDLFSILKKNKRFLIHNKIKLECPLKSSNDGYINFSSTHLSDSNTITQKTWKEIFDI